MPEPPIPYCRQFTGEEEIAALAEVLRGGWIARGPRAVHFEDACAERLQASHAISCSSGSSALEIALRGLGVGPGDEVLVPTLTWVATAMAVRLVGATPVFADVDPDTLALTPETALEGWSARTRAVIAVDMAGVPHDARALRELCEERGAWLVEDAAHAFGARFPDGAAVGADGRAHVATFSFHPAKTITTAEGGLLTCADPGLAERLRRIRSGGITRDFEGSRGRYDFRATDLGGNHHLSELHAALGLVQLGRLDRLLELRRGAARALGERLAELGANVLLPTHPQGSSWNLFIVRLPDEGSPAEVAARRDELLTRLQSQRIATHVHYPLLHRQPVFRAPGARRRFPQAERYERTALSLPLFPGMTAAEIERVAAALAAALPGANAAAPPASSAACEPVP